VLVIVADAINKEREALPTSVDQGQAELVGVEVPGHVEIGGEKHNVERAIAEHLAGGGCGSRVTGAGGHGLFAAVPRGDHH